MRFSRDICFGKMFVGCEVWSARNTTLPCRVLTSHTARLTEAQQRAAGAAQAAQRADDAYVAAQELVQSLREQSSAADKCLSAATSHVEECLVTLAAAETANKAAQEAMKVRSPILIYTQ